MDIVNLIANEFEMSNYMREGRKLNKIDKDEFLKNAKQKWTQEDFERFKKYEAKISSYYFKKEREIIKFTLDFVKLIQK